MIAVNIRISTLVYNVMVIIHNQESFQKSTRNPAADYDHVKRIQEVEEAFGSVVSRVMESFSCIRLQEALHGQNKRTREKICVSDLVQCGDM